MGKKLQFFGKLLFVVLLLGIIFYSFRDSMGPILKALQEVPWYSVVIISLLSIGYEFMEGWVTYSFAKKYNPKFTYLKAVESAFYCSFYRVATLGSGAGVAALVFFKEEGIPVFKGTGMYMVEYALHKLTTAIFSVVFFVLNLGFMLKHYEEYSFLLVGGYAITVILTMVLLLFCCSSGFHHLLQWLFEKVNRKGRWDKQVEEFKGQCVVLEEAAKDLLDSKRFITSIIGKNMLKFALWYGIPYVVLYETHAMNFSQAIAITSLSVMLAAVIPSPAGIGASEFVLAALFAVLVGTAQAGSASLMYRFATFVLPFAIGGAIVVIRNIRHKMHQRKGE